MGFHQLGHDLVLAGQLGFELFDLAFLGVLDGLALAAVVEGGMAVLEELLEPGVELGGVDVEFIAQVGNGTLSSRCRFRSFSTVADMVRSVSENKEKAEETARAIEERSIINFLVGLRTAQELSQSDIASKMKCTQSKVSKLESGIDDNLTLGDFHAYTRDAWF